jgi:hypothetical protein
LPCKSFSFGLDPQVIWLGALQIDADAVFGLQAVCRFGVIGPAAPYLPRNKPSPAESDATLKRQCRWH